ncbi:MAG: RluA family pseudouridine synthase [Bacteroidales bacterium]|jgi:23S rRNA pseudouridine1911/1915/1917 synthase|nr:RluA family pseudouridine synthase [Bacteroidales bacterium]MBQ1831162.1 RluA family pseudouridine synthase [Bacteroidales bacterium]MBQ2194424.1 RluA family pseudouridine synthase [Bacteroidales bacterium]MBQ5517128.1 RluA family pseudouridine synthase [Bacteroidales bacterium]MBQ5530178.1 RluA family pseudouridine synthase [Bacteroidales bacterium]
MSDETRDDLLPEDEQQEMFEHFRLEADRGQSPLRIDKYLADHLQDTSRHRVQLAIDAEYVRVNGQVVKASYKVRPLDVITLEMPYQRRGVEIKPEPIPLNIVYEDDDLLVVNKPAGLVVHPGHGNYSGTLVNALAYYLGKEPVPGETDERLGLLVHRIDKDTSGLLVVAKTDAAQIDLARQFFRHTIERRYWALVWGNIAEDEGTIDAPIGRDPNDRLRFRVCADETLGKHAVTHFRVIERFGYVTLVECRLETGRTHQIRVHMNHIGHPLFNDARYGGDRILKGTLYTKYKQFIDNCFALCPRQALHAKTLGFIHPTTKKEISLDSEIPSDMAALLEKWRRYAGFNVLEEDEES